MQGRLEAGIQYFEKQGFKVKLGRHNTKCDRFLAGSDEDRTDDVMHFFNDKDIKALIATGGGYGSQRILPFLDYDVIRKNPKIVVGSSDTTALQLGLLKRAGLVSYTGFTCGDVHDQALDLSIEQTLLSCLTNQSYCVEKGIGVHPGIIEAPLVGGNLECLIALMGTPYQPDFKGSILFIEEVRQEPYKIDCMLSHLDLAGIMDQVVGVVFCQFEKCLANYFPDRDGTVDDVINEWAKRLTVPVIKNFPYGHGSNYQYVLPIGGKVRLDANAHSLAVIF
jgi:muramoyltetrapeptide carboxypeptidase